MDIKYILFSLRMRVHITSLTPPLLLKFRYQARILSCNVSILILFLHLNCYDSDLLRGRFICLFIFCLFFLSCLFSFLWGGRGRGLDGSCVCVIIWLYLFLLFCFVLFCFCLCLLCVLLYPNILCLQLQYYIVILIK